MLKERRMDLARLADSFIVRDIEQMERQLGFNWKRIFGFFQNQMVVLQYISGDGTLLSPMIAMAVSDKNPKHIRFIYEDLTPQGGGWSLNIIGEPEEVFRRYWAWVKQNFG